jgi:hypothetical protein
MKKKTKKAAVKRKKSVVKKDDRLQEMKVGKRTYTVGDVGWFVDERSQLKRPRSRECEVTGVYPTDDIEPALGIREFQGQHRAIRARLLGDSKAEAQKNFEIFVKSEEKKKKKCKKK